MMEGYRNRLELIDLVGNCELLIHLKELERGLKIYTGRMDN